MRAAVGDRVVVMSAHVDQPTREGEVVEVHGSGGDPPWVVRWDADGHQTVFFPGPDTRVQPAAGSAS